MKRIMFMVMAVIMLIFNCNVSVMAKMDAEDFRDSVIYISATVQFTPSNLNMSPINSYSAGTGFAVGMPGKDIQYVATCAHVVQEPAGIYAVYINQKTGAYAGRVKMGDGTYYPAHYNESVDGVVYDVYCDYFTTKTTALKALFSESDYVSLTTTQIDTAADLAVCKLASDPINKRIVLPIQLKEKVKLDTDVIAVGYPSTSEYLNAEVRYDSSDSTLKPGAISKLQRVNARDGGETTFDAYEVTAELTTGMSGGPVISKQTGAVIGITAFGSTDASQAASARYAVCVDYLAEMLDREGIKYKVYNAVPIGLIIGIIAVIIIAAAVNILAVNKKKGSSVKAVAGNVNVYQNNDAGIGKTTNIEKKYYIYGISGPLSGKKYRITKNAVIGRDKTRCNIVFPIDQPGVSGLHCEVQVSGDVITLRDCNSSYGTFTDGGRLNPDSTIVLKSGDRFWIGSRDNEFEVRY